MKNERWFELDIAQVEKKLKTNAASGLSLKAARSRWNHASGSFLLPRVKSPLRMLGELLADFSLILLLLCAVFALFFDDFQNGISVLVISALYVGVSFLLYYRTQRTLEAVRACFRPQARVIRGGKLYIVDFSRVVLGDVLLLERGDIVAADLRLVTSDSLHVRMQTDVGTYVSLEKYAGGVPRPNENDATKLVNVLHAGSVIESGNARGIVIAVGKYTYLAAKTGGVPERLTEEIPASLKRMRKFCSWLGMVSLLCVLPFCLVSLFISHFNHGDVLLSSAFLTALSIAASSMSQLALTVYKAFFAVKLRAAVQGKVPSAVRSAAALDRLCHSDYLFVLDGAALSDGRMHFDTALTFEGEVRRYDLLSPSATVMGRLTALYCMAEKRSLSIGMDETAPLSDALNEFFSACRIDQGALAIQYPSLTYFPGNAEHVPNSVRYFEHGSERWISLSLQDVLDECSEAVMYGQIRPLSQDGVARLQALRRQYMAQGKQVMLLSTLEPKSGIRCFVGMLVLRDGRDPLLDKRIRSLCRIGLKPIFFVPAKSNEKMPQMTQEIFSLPGVSIHEWKQKKLPITQNFGKYARYDGVEEEDILALMSFVKKQKKHVAVLSFTDACSRVLEEADAVIACSSVYTSAFFRGDSEIYSMEIVGTQSSSSCTQSMKERADVLIARPHDGQGGLGALLVLRRMAMDCYHNLSSFVAYALCTQLMRLLAVALPMLFGSAALNARHILVCSFVIDLVALVLFWQRREMVDGHEPMSQGLGEYLERHRELWISAAVGALSLVILPRLMDFLAWIGPFYFKVEFSFSAILYLHLTVLFVLLIGRPKDLVSVLHKTGFLILTAGVVLFLILCFALEPIGVLFDVVTNPPAYALLAFVPSVLFASVYYGLMRRKRKGK